MHEAVSGRHVGKGSGKNMARARPVGGLNREGAKLRSFYYWDGYGQNIYGQLALGVFINTSFCCIYGVVLREYTLGYWVLYCRVLFADRPLLFYGLSVSVTFAMMYSAQLFMWSIW